MKRDLTSQQVVDAFLLKSIEPLTPDQQLTLYRAISAAPHCQHLSAEARKLADKVELLQREKNKTRKEHRFEALARMLSITEQDL